MKSRQDVRILLVDDRPENLVALEAILEPLGVSLDRATSGEEALRHLLSSEYACVVLDVQMPGMNGFETARFIKSRERTRHLPIIFLTAISKEDRYVYEGYAAGAVDYIFKPFEPEILRSKVSVFVDLQRKNWQIADQVEQLREVERESMELRHAAELSDQELRSAEQLRVINDELRARQAELERAIGARNRFYASMSHELRTPINAVLGYTTLLLDEIYGPITEKQSNSLRRVEKAAQHLLELVNDVLDLSKIEAGKIEMSVEKVSFPSLIEDLFVSVRPLADERGTPLSVRHENGNDSITTDPRRVRQIVLNLLSNAIKFGNAKPVDVTTRGLENGGMEIEVRDHGAGIAPENISRIFDEFVQLESTREQGTGLGLPISRRLAVLLGGKLSVQSTPGVGSSFVLSLPKRLEDGMRTLVADAPTRQAAQSGKESSRRGELVGSMRKDAREEATN